MDDGNTLNIEPKFAFDLRDTQPHNVHFLRKDTLLYPVGRHFALHKFNEPTVRSGTYVSQVTKLTGRV